MVIFSRKAESFDEFLFRMPDLGCRMNQYSTTPGSYVNVGNAGVNDMRCLRHRGLFEESRLVGMIPQGSQLIGSRAGNSGVRPLRGRMSDEAGVLMNFFLDAGSRMPDE